MNISQEQILEWADAFRDATGRWPQPDDAPPITAEQVQEWADAAEQDDAD